MRDPEMPPLVPVEKSMVSPTHSDDDMIDNRKFFYMILNTWRKSQSH